MNPDLEDKFIEILNSTYLAVTQEAVEIDASIEAYGTTLNQGLCHEFIAQSTFTGDINGHLFLGLDGYSKLQMLPYVAKKFHHVGRTGEVADRSLLSYMNELTRDLNDEAADLVNVEFAEAALRNHELISIPIADFRKFMLIYFLKDLEKKIYLGRAYLFLAIEK